MGQTAGAAFHSSSRLWRAPEPDQPAGARGVAPAIAQPALYRRGARGSAALRAGDWADQLSGAAAIAAPGMGMAEYSVGGADVLVRPVCSWRGPARRPIAAQPGRDRPGRRRAATRVRHRLHRPVFATPRL